MEFLLSVISYVAFIGLAVSLLILGFVGGFLKYCDIIVDAHYWNRFQSQTWETYVKSRQELAKESRNFKSDKRLSGSVLIDDELQDLIQLSLRDFVENWYTNISDDKEFIFEARKALGSAFVTISSRCKEVDWLNNFLPKVMDVLAMHIRLYKTPTVNYVQITSTENNDFVGIPTRVPEDFFELEAFGSLKTRYTRKKIFEDRNFEMDSLKVISDALLWLASPIFEFHNRPLELLVSQFLLGGFMFPSMESTIDPDYINQIVIWMCSSINTGGDSLVSILRSSGLSEELEAVVDLLNKELQALRSHDLGGNETNDLNKRQISSLLFLKELIEKRMQNELQGSNGTESAVILKRIQQETPYIMSLEEILKNSVSLSYFLDFLSSQDLQGFLLFLLSIEGWKGSVINESALDLHPTMSGTSASDLSRGRRPDELSVFRDAAQNIVEQYFSSCVTSPIDVDEAIIAAVYDKLRSGVFDETLFDEIEQTILEKFQNEERFLSAFYRSDAYLQMLVELGLGKQLPRLEKFSEVDSSAVTSKDHTGPCRTGESTNSKESDASRNYSTSSCVKVIKLPSRPITAHIIDKGVYRDKIGSHIVYTVLVRKLLNGKEVDQWVVHRRYSDFYDFHNRLGQKCKLVYSLPFPAKRAFNNMDHKFLEIRKKRLNEYLDKLTEEDVTSTFPELPSLLLDFLRKDCEPQKGRIFKKMDNIVTPLLSSFKTMSRTMRPNPLEKESQLQTLGPRTQMSPFFISDSDDVALSMEADNMAVRVILFLMDEIFDLRYRNQWLRRSALLMLRELLQAMFGDVFDEKINELLLSLTSASQLADNIRSVKNKLWPGGVFYYVPAPVRAKNIKMRTRVAAKTVLMSCVSDEIKHLIGNETTRLGIVQTFELFQNPLLNRRLIYLIAETLLTTLFSHNNFSNFFLKLHYVPKEC